MKRNANRSFEEFTINPFEIQNNQLELRQCLDEIDSRNIRLKFKSSADPINLAFDAFQNTSVKTLAIDFIQESFSDLISFVSKICK